MIPKRWSREWIGPGDFYPDKHGHPKCSPDMAHYTMRWVATKRQSFDIDGVLVKGRWYNKYMEGHLIAMPAPLMDGAIEYDDGTEPTLEQLSSDVTTFLA